MSYGHHLQAMRTQARLHGLEPNKNAKLNDFLKHVAELLDAGDIREREAMRIVHAPLHKTPTGVVTYYQSDPIKGLSVPD